ncbi:MAG: NAD(FAD)-utilizing dehydrogenase [Clostridiales bacterium]|nr:NAD(FAD)-utilizing dehydrogenase [Clostridiales bacterium]
MYRINEIKLRLGEDKGSIPEKIKEKLKTKAEIKSYRIAKESVDARDKGDILYVYTVDFDTDAEFPNLKKAPNSSYTPPTPGTGLMKGRPVIAGFGPCGMFAALVLSELGYAPVVLERGKQVDERVKDVERFWKDGILDEESNVQFGEGGAGAFSDGKLTTGIKDARVGKVLRELVLAGAGDDILYKQHPHVGTDVLRGVVKNIRKKIVENGGELMFQTRLEGIVSSEGRLEAVKASSPAGDFEIKTQTLILAVGHSARDTIRALGKDGVLMEQKPFSIGIRIEHLQEAINEAQYGKNADKRLPPAEYKLAHRCRNGRGVYTFCMCPGGEVIAASSQKGFLATNGMSNRARDGERANSAVLVDVRVSDYDSSDPLSGIAFQEKYESAAYWMAGGRYQPLPTTWGEFANGAKTAQPVINSLPGFAVSGIREAMPVFANKLKGFDNQGAVVYAVESRSSSPVRIMRNKDFQCNIAGVYPCGEGAGYSGGIMSAAVDGINAAEEIVRKFSRRE